MRLIAVSQALTAVSIRRRGLVRMTKECFLCSALYRFSHLQECLLPPPDSDFPINHSAAHSGNVQQIRKAVGFSFRAKKMEMNGAVSMPPDRRGVMDAEMMMMMVPNSSCRAPV